MLTNPTINQQLRNRMLSETKSKKVFKPSSAFGARDAVLGKNDKMMYQNPFGYSKYMQKDYKKQ